MSSDGAMRKFLQTNIRRGVGSTKELALTFSGGTDSFCMLVAALDLGLSVNLYTYVVEGTPSVDVERAFTAAASLGLAEPVIGTIPSDVDSLVADVIRMLRDGIRGKVAIQCLHGYYYLAPLMTETVVLNGAGVDALYGSYRTFAFDGSRDDKMVFDRARKRHLVRPNDDAMLDLTRLFEQHGPHAIYPYRSPNIIDFLMSKSWKEINTPKLKHITTQDFQTEYDKMPAKFWRARGSQQIIAGTRALHDKLLALPINRCYRKRVNELYDDLIQEMEHGYDNYGPEVSRNMRRLW